VSGQVRIELYVDPCCPFAWIAYQWLAEVQQHRAVELGLHLMSLSGYSQLSVVPCLVNGFMPRVGRRWSAGYELGSGRDFCIPDRCV
jgi:hypothetical protein